MPLNLVTLIDKQGPIFYIHLHAYEYEPFCFFAAVSMVGVARPKILNYSSYLKEKLVQSQKQMAVGFKTRI